MKDFKVAKLFKTAEELRIPEEAELSGTLPNWLKGTFLRTGPGKFDLEDFTMCHWMDGYALLQKFVINGNSVTFEKRFLKSDAYTRSLKAQKPVIAEYGTRAFPDASKSFISRMITSVIPELTDNDNIALFKIGREVFTTTETCFFRDINPSTLTSGEKYDTNKCFGLNLASPHPILDESTGITYNLGFSFLTGLKYNIIKIPASNSNKSAKDLLKKSTLVCSISSTWPTGMMSYTHSFGMSKNYIILIEQPFLLNISKLLASVFNKGQSIKDWMEWRPDLGNNRFYIIEKETGKVLKTEYVSTEPFFFLHIINCYEENEHIIIDLTTCADQSFLEDMYMSEIRLSGLPVVPEQPQARRFVLPVVTSRSNKDILKNGDQDTNMIASIKTEATAKKRNNQIVLTSENLTEKGLEFPVINNKFIGKKYNYFYASGFLQTGYFENAVCKVDVFTKKTTIWRQSNMHYFGEPMFIQNPNCISEDDGVLIVAVSDVQFGASDFILFLDAQNMTELGRAKFNAHIPQALHGIFLQA